MGRKTIRWKIIVIPGMIVGLLIGLFIFSGLYNVCIMRTQLIQSDTDMLQIIRKNTDERLELITKVLVLTVVQDDYAEQLDLFTEDGLTEMEKINKYYAMRTLQDEIRVQKKNFSYLDGMAVFSTYSKLITGVYGSLDKEKIEDFVWKLCEDDSILAYQKKWKAVAFGGEYYLVTVRSDGTKHAIAWIKASELLNIEAKGEMKSICGIYMQNEENDLLGAVKYTDDFQALRCIQGKSENILLSEKSKKGEITICMETASANIFAGMTGIQILLLLIAFGCMAIVPILHRVLTRNVTVPIEELIHSMNVFENGNTEAFVDTENKTLEFEKLGNSFNSMIA